jgi:hypothetical protein
MFAAEVCEIHASTAEPKKNAKACKTDKKKNRTDKPDSSNATATDNSRHTVGTHKKNKSHQGDFYL